MSVAVASSDSQEPAWVLYRRFVLPRLIDLAMKDKAAAARRSELIPRATGVVLEVGIASGLNLPFYSSAVTHVHDIDPSAELLSMARGKIARLRKSTWITRGSPSPG
jgi:protein-L-isoaspartate O-methyltransferase